MASSGEEALRRLSAGGSLRWARLRKSIPELIAFAFAFAFAFKHPC
jgi:hypothetical protein